MGWCLQFSNEHPNYSIYILDGASDYRGLQLKHALWSLKGRFQHNMNKVTRTNTESKQPRLMEHGTTCMSCWTPNAFYWQPPKKKPWTNYPPVSSNMACRKIHHVQMCCVQMIPPANFRPPFSSGISNCYLWWPEGSGRLSVKKHFTPNKVLMTKWPQRNCQNKDALGRSNGLQHTCGK